MQVTNSIKYIGVEDKKIDLFESQYLVPDGITYNSYVVIDDKIAVIDTVDAKYTDEWLRNLEAALDGRTPDYLVVQHMEPDHSANIVNFVASYPDSKIVSSKKAFDMMKNFFGTDFSDKQIVVTEGSVLSLGAHEFVFYTAPMVHWPEVIVTYEKSEKIIFSADGFGKFGTDFTKPWADEARRYYIGIVGKYGAQVQSLLKKLTALDISIICPLHGPVITENIGYYVGLYDKWSSYQPEEEGIVIAYASIYGNTKKVSEQLSESLKQSGSTVAIYDLARCDMAEAVSDAFRYSKLVLASATYNATVFPPMREYISKLAERGFTGRTVGLIENGSWAPTAAKVMKEMLSSCKGLTFTDTVVRVLSAPNDSTAAQLDSLKNEILK